MYCAHQAGSATFGAERSFLFMLEQARKTGMAIDAVLPYCLDAGYLSAVRARARAVWLIPYTWRRAGRGPHRVTLAALSHAIRVSGAAELHQNTLVCDAPLLAARRAGIRGIVHIRELPDHDPELCARIGLSGEDLRRDLLEQADEFVANSDTTARWIDPSGRLGARLRIVPNTVEDALFDLQFAPARPVRVGLVSSNVAKKGIADARAVALTCDRLGLPVDMLLIGPATTDLSALYPLPPNMRHAGYAAGPIAVMARLDIVLSLSHFAESFGRSVLEAMAAGRPVIAYDRGHPPTLIGANAGRVVAVDDPDAVARALQDLLVTPGALIVASAAARARARALLANDRRSGIASDAVGSCRASGAEQGLTPRLRPAGAARGGFCSALCAVQKSAPDWPLPWGVQCSQRRKTVALYPAADTRRINIVRYKTQGIENGGR